MPVSYLRRAKSSDLEQLVSFLEDNGLPTIGVESCYPNFVIAADETGALLGVAGLEIYGQSALLRSVAVQKNSRRMGHGRTLVDAVLEMPNKMESIRSTC